MLNLNIKMAWRNFWKNRRYTLLNILGLGIALTLFLLALLYRNSEMRYDRWNPGHENVYRVQTQEDDGPVALVPIPFAPAVRGLPPVQAATTASYYYAGELLLTVGPRSLYQSNIIFADSAFFSVFQYPLVYGDASTAFREPNTVALSKVLSETLFGKGVNPIGEMVKMGDIGVCKVTAVIDRDAYPSHIPFDCIIRRGFHSLDWTSNNAYVYLRCSPHATPYSYATALDKNYADMAMGAILADTTDKFTASDIADYRKEISDRKFRFEPVDPIHLNSSVRYEWVGNGSGRYLDSLYLVVLIILVMAAINFTNLSVAYATRRAKETGLRKVIGAARGQLVAQFLAETFFQCVLALCLALILAELMLPFINARLDMNIHGWIRQDTLSLLGQLFLCVGVTTLMAGLYPALVMSGYLPAIVLKGNFSGGARGVRVRRVLLVAQFTCAAVFASGIFVIVRQTNYMRKMDLGYDASQVMAVRIHSGTTNERFSSVRDRLAAIPGVAVVSRTSQIQGEGIGSNGYSYKGRAYSLDFLAVDAHYCAAMGLPLLQGRDFDGLHPVDTNGSVLVNETFARMAGIKRAGEFLEHAKTQYEVVGIVKDFPLGHPQDAILPMIFQLLRNNGENYVLIRMDSRHAGETVQRISAAWSDIEPGYPIQYTFLDEHFAALFRSQEHFGFLFGIFSTMALILAVMGVVSLAAYTAERKTKEISIRKVLGATTGQILTLLNKDFVRWVLLANLLALPLSLWLMSRWLQGYAYRIHLGLWPYLLTLVVSLGATVLVVTLQSLRASTARPIEALKYE
ncbi:MAG TPA: ABC transporter permease [Dinghuibacter sp.]|uniref:ABC transporter permease n=1 Tax=Dinghuibacter sp. TaxID=2024697 RepID=UPI002D0465B3|nr:ABC transporter permease [Dinghuibacter sp.]HTJ14293.1 ABC transporter permease [Dinghuibacter sp.]